MNPDGSMIECIGINVGRDLDPIVFPDGRIGFCRMDLMYSNLKVETIPYSMLADGTGLKNLYGPRRRMFWENQALYVNRQNWFWSPGAFYNSLGFSQPTPFGQKGDFILTTASGPIKPSFDQMSETFLLSNDWAVTGQFPLDDNRFICAAQKRIHGDVGKHITYEHPWSMKSGVGKLPHKNPIFENGFRCDTQNYSTEQAKAMNADLGLYVMNAESGEMRLIYKEDGKALFEPRPIWKRTVPQQNVAIHNRRGATGNLMCMSVFTSDNPRVARRAKWVRFVRGTPYGTRHHNNGWQKKQNDNYFRNPVWMNHVGTHARVLGTVPLAADGSFSVQVPADQHLQCVLLDADMQVVGTELVWQYVRPGENKSCVGCHEMSTAAPDSSKFPIAVRQAPVVMLPETGQFSYNASVYRRFDNLHMDVTDEALWYTQSYDAICRP